MTESDLWGHLPWLISFDIAPHELTSRDSTWFPENSAQNTHTPLPRRPFPRTRTDTKTRCRGALPDRFLGLGSRVQPMREPHSVTPQTPAHGATRNRGKTIQKIASALFHPPPSGLEALGGKCPTARKERGSLNACSTHARSLRAIHHQPMRMRLRTRPRGHEVQSVYKTQGKQ